MLTQTQIDEFHRNGFLNGGRVLSDEEIGELGDALDEILDQRSQMALLPVRRSRYPSAT